MRLLHAGVDISVIALWLGHEAIETAQMYMHVDLLLKERACRAPRRSVRPQGVTDPLTSCSRFWKRSDYVDTIWSSTAGTRKFASHST